MSSPELGKSLRTTVSYLLIVAVLACPYLCLGEASGAPVASCKADHCRCPHNGDRSGREAPQSPADESGDCLCYGAIVDGLRSVDLDYSPAVAVTWLDGDSLLSPIGTSLALGAISFEQPHQFPPLSSGRDVCALTCALLF